MSTKVTNVSNRTKNVAPYSTVLEPGDSFTTTDPSTKVLGLLLDAGHCPADFQIFGTVDRAASSDLLIYLDADKGDDANPGTQTLPVKTVDGAIALRAKLWTPNTKLDRFIFTPTATKYLWGEAAAVQCNYVIGNNLTRTAAGDRHVWVGAMAATPTASKTVSSASTTTMGGKTVATVTPSGGGLVADAYRGLWLRYTSGAQSGRQYLVASNSTTVITLVGPHTGSAPSASDTFVIEDVGVTVEFQSQLNTNLIGGLFAAFGIQFQVPATSAASLVVTEGCRANFGTCRFKLTNGGSGRALQVLGPGSVVTFSGNFANTAASFGAVGANLSAPAVGYGTSGAGCHVINGNATGGLLVGNGARLSAGSGNVLDNAPVVVWDGGVAVVFASARHNGTNPMFWVETASNTTIVSAGTLTVGGTAVSSSTGLVAKVTGNGVLIVGGASTPGLDCNGHTGGGILVTGPNARAFLTGVTGTISGTGSIGVQASAGAQIQVTDPNTGTTISGASGAAKPGNLAVSTWAQIAGGTAALCTDLADASSQMCRIGA